MNKNIEEITQISEVNVAKVQEPYASIDLSNVLNTPDGNTGIKITLLQPSVLSADVTQASHIGEISATLDNITVRNKVNSVEEVTSQNATKGSGFLKKTLTPLPGSVKLFDKSDKINPKSRSFIVGKGFAHTDLHALSKYKGKVVSLEELQQHVNIPGLTDRLKAKTGSKLKIVMLKKNQIKKYLDKQTTPSNREMRYNVQDSNMKRNPIPSGTRKTLEIAPPQTPEMNKYEYKTLLSLDEQKLDSVKSELEEFLKGIPYEPNMKFSNLLQKFLFQRHRQQPIAALQRDHKPDDTQYSKYAICCTVPKCGNAIFRHGSNWEPFETPKSFFTFPDDREMAEKWMNTIRRSDLTDVPHEELLTYRICEDHFRNSDFANDEKSELSTDAMPFDPENIHKSHRRQRQVKRSDIEIKDQLRLFSAINATYEKKKHETEIQIHDSIDIEKFEKQQSTSVTLETIHEFHPQQDECPEFDDIEITDQINILPVSDETDETVHDTDQLEESIDLENDQLAPVLSDHSYTELCTDDNVILHDNDFVHPVFYEEIVEEDEISFTDITTSPS